MRRKSLLFWLAALAGLLGLLWSFPGITAANAAVGDTTRVSVASDGTQADWASYSPAVSADGRYVAFASGATNLVANDTNNAHDIFVYDRTDHRITRVSISSGGAQASGSRVDLSRNPAISADGRYVVFESDATNLVNNDTNNTTDIFLHDRVTGETVRVSVASDGSQANGASYNPAISADGRYIVFESEASNLVSGDTNGKRDIFIHDMNTGETKRVSVASDGTQANDDSLYPAISANGRLVAFASYASNLVAGDTNGVEDIFVHDLRTGKTVRVSVASDGTQANDTSFFAPSLSADGRYVAFYSEASNLVSNDTNNKSDIFVHDLMTGTTERISVASDGSQANGSSTSPSISADGRYVAFDSDAPNLANRDTNNASDIFVHDRFTGETERVSVDSNGAQADSDSYTPALAAANPSIVAFQSYATNLVTGDTNNSSDIFVHEWQLPTANPPTNVFSDVADTHWAVNYINRLYRANITTGCATNPLQYCPGSPVTRAQMAVFLLKSMNYPIGFTPPNVQPTFPDTAGHWAEDWIEALKDAGITSGYPDGTYQPNRGVTRAEMAVFLLRAEHGANYNPPAVAHSRFSDVPDSHWAKDWIEQLAKEGITSGYPDGTYRPNNIVTRAEMAVFLVKIFGLP